MIFDAEPNIQDVSEAQKMAKTLQITLEEYLLLKLIKIAENIEIHTQS